jgi:gluconolactonase
VTRYVRSPAGVIVTNGAFQPDTPRPFMTESQTGSILEAELPTIGVQLFGSQL